MGLQTAHGHFQTDSIDFVKCGRLVRVDIEDCDQLIPAKHGNHDLRPCCGVASDVIGEVGDIGNELGPTGAGGGSTNAPVEGYFETTQRPLVGAYP